MTVNNNTPAASLKINSTSKDGSKKCVLFNFKLKISWRVGKYLFAFDGGVSGCSLDEIKKGIRVIE